MSETTLWLNYGLSAVIAFVVIYFWGWRVIAAILLATAVSLSIWFIASIAAGGLLNDPWLGFGLATNASFSAIFAGAGAYTAKFSAELRRP